MGAVIRWGRRGPVRYDFFVSYAHEDREQVRQLDRALRELLRRPFRRYGFNTFRDETRLGAGDDLGDRLRRGMAASSWLLVVLTRASVRSRWVDREIDHWCAALGRADRMIIVRADDTVDLAWDDSGEGGGSFARPDGLPPALAAAVRADPLWVDAAGAESSAWHDAAVRVAAAVLDRPPEDVAGEDYRMHRRRRRRVAQAITVLSITTAVAVLASVVAVSSSASARRAQREAERARRDAEDNAALAVAQQAQAVAGDRPALGLALAAEALARRPSPATAEALQATYLAYGQAPAHRQRTIAAHSDIVRAVRFTPDGRLLATGADDGTAKVWEAATGELVATVDSGIDAVESIALSPDGTLLATPSDVGVTLWDPATGEEVSRFEHDGWVWSVAFNHDGTRLAMTGTDALAEGLDNDVVKVWDTATRAPVVTLTGHTGSVGGVAFNHDGTLLATASYDGTAKLWDPATGRLVSDLVGHTSDLTGEVEFSHDGSRLATIAYDGTARLWDPATGREVGTIERIGSFGLAFNPDDSLVATTDIDGTVRISDVATGEERTLLAESAVSLAFAPDGTSLAAGLADGTVELWSLAGARGVVTVQRAVEVEAVAVEGAGTTFATGGIDGVATVWDSTTGDELLARDHRGAPVEALEFSPDDTQLATVTNGMLSGSRLTVWDLVSGREITAVAEEDPLLDLAYSPDGTLVAFTGSTDETRLWSLASGSERPALPNPGLVSQVAFSPDGTLLAAVGTVSPGGGGPGDDRPFLRLWDPATGREVAARDLPGTRADALAFSPDGRVLATTDDEGTITFWDPATGAEVATIDAHDDRITSLAYSPDGTLLASTSQDGTAKLWEPSTGRLVTDLPGHSSGVTGAAFSRDGTTIATSSLDGATIVRRLVLTPADACALVTTEVTVEELTEALAGSAPEACTDLG